MALERIARWPFAQRGGARVDRRWYELRAAAAGHAPTGRPVIRRPGKRSAWLRSLYAGRGMRQNLLEVATCVLLWWLVAVEEVKRQKKLCLRSMNSLMPSDFATTMGVDIVLEL